MIEYGVLHIKKLKKKNKLEEELNRLVRDGWRVKTYCGDNKLLLMRKIKIRND